VAVDKYIAICQKFEKPLYKYLHPEFSVAVLKATGRVSHGLGSHSRDMATLESQ
jgi:hypothetical protein